MPPQGLDLLVDALNLAAGDLEGCMGNDPLEVLVEKSAKPEKMTVAGGLVDQEIGEVLQETEVLAEMVQRSVEENSRVAQDQDEYNKRYEGLRRRYEAASAKLAALREKRIERQKKAEAMGRFIQRLAERDEELKEFTADQERVRWLPFHFLVW